MPGTGRRRSPSGPARPPRLPLPVRLRSPARPQAPPGPDARSAGPDAAFTGAAQALAGLRAALGYLNRLDAASLPAAVQVACLRELEQAESAHTAARARVLAAFMAQDGQAADGQRSARVWLEWHTRVSEGAAKGAVGWARRLGTRPGMAAALAAGVVSASWAREICQMLGKLPDAAQPEAETILLEAAQGKGVTLADLAGLAEEIRRRTAIPDTDGNDPAPDPGDNPGSDGNGPGCAAGPGDSGPGDSGRGSGGPGASGPGSGGPGVAGGDRFGDRRLFLGITFGGAGYLDGELTPECAAAVQAVLDALGKKRGPEDERTPRQRHHDALEEACRLLIGSASGPAGPGSQPTSSCT